MAFKRVIIWRVGPLSWLLGDKSMAFTELEQKRIEKAASRFIEKNRPAVHIRPELDLGFRLTGQSIELFEIRPAWKAEHLKQERPVAKATYIKAQEIWRIYWQRADLKWHRYEPIPDVESIDEFLAVVEQDEYCCFWG
jgi:Protein of unknown function (DUF3024)